MTTDGARVLAHDTSGFSGGWRDAYFDEWRDKGSLEQMQARWAAQRAFVASLPATTKIVTISIVHDAAIKPLEGEQRKGVQDNVDELAPRVKAATVVVLAGGFKSAFVRGIIATLTLVSRATYQSKTADALEPAFEWVAPRMDGGVTPAALMAAYRDIERAAAAGAAAPR
jgi:hypothetical protein